MTKRTFHYCGTHKEDEAYMQQMCAQGWAALRLVEGFWTFAPCAPNAYCYRVCYLRGKTRAQVQALKEAYAAKGISFVSRYSFWAIFRSTAPFTLYSPEEEKAVCRKIYAPMLPGAVLSWLLTVLGLILSLLVCPWFLILTLLLGLYGMMCTWLAISYRRLIARLEQKN